MENIIEKLEIRIQDIRDSDFTESQKKDLISSAKRAIDSMKRVEEAVK